MPQHDKVVREEFARQADALASAAVFNDRTILARICDAAALGPDSRVLDVACGPGIVLEALASHAGEAVGCDITPAMLQKAQQRTAARRPGNVRCVCARAERLPFPDAGFDAVVSRSAVHHFTEPARIFAEMARVTRPGGRVVTVDVVSAESPEESRIHNALERLRDPSHVRMLPRSELHRLLAQAGLTVERCVTWVNAREFGEWMKIVSAPERVEPIGIVMQALAQAGVRAGIELRHEAGRVLFDHTAALTVAVKN